MLRRALPVLLLTLAACSGAERSSPLPVPVAAANPQAPTKVTSPREGHREFTIAVTLRMVVTGESTLEPIEAEAKLRVVEILGGKNPKEIWFYSVSPAAPVETPDGRLLLFSADLAPGVYDGPGRYELSEQAGVTVAGKSGLGSGAYVQIYRPVTEGQTGEDFGKTFRRFDLFGAPCVLNVAPESMTGTVDCPSLRDEDGREVELHWNWGRA